MKVRSLLACLCLITSFSLGANAKKLVGEIQHSDSLQPVDAALTPGQIYDPSKAPFPDKHVNNWYKIPPWLAGTWQKESQTDFYRFNYQTGETDTTTRVIPAKSSGTWGTQIDEKGNIWQFDPAPFTATVDSGDNYVVQLVSISDPVEVSDDRLIRRSIDTQIRVQKSDNMITAVEKGEQLTTYLPQSDGLLKRESSAKVFDKSGKPVLLGRSFSYETRINAFSPQDIYKGKDMKMLFQLFQKDQSETGSATSTTQ